MYILPIVWFQKVPIHTNGYRGVKSELIQIFKFSDGCLKPKTPLQEGYTYMLEQHCDHLFPSLVTSRTFPVLMVCMDIICSVPENIQTPSTEAIEIFWGLGL